MLARLPGICKFHFCSNDLLRFNTVITKTPTDVLIDFLTRQMDGDHPPASGSAAEREVAQAIQAIHADGSDKTLNLFALRTLGALIDRMRSNIAAEQALRNAFKPGGAV